MSETWNPIPGYEGYYEVSNLGRVRSLDRIVYVDQKLRSGKRKSVQKPFSGRLLRPGIASHGYPTVSLRGETRTVHSIVAESFIGSRPVGMQVCHKNGNKKDPRLSNLRYDTIAENFLDRAAHGTLHRGTGYKTAKLNETEARIIRRLKRKITQSRLAEIFGISPAAIQAVHDGRTWTHMYKSLSIDVETRSTVDLKKSGAHRYFDHTSTDVLVACYAFDDGPVEQWTPSMPPPPEINGFVLSGGTIRAFNAQFERLCWWNILSPRYGWVKPRLNQFQCTMVMALAMSLPGSLEQAAAAVGLETQKDMSGRRHMLQMCKPRRIEKDGTVVWWNDDKRKDRLYAYCKTDVEVERGLAKRLLPLRRQEQELWQLDQVINDRGARIDRSLVEAARQVVEATMEELNREMREVTDNAVCACTNVGQLVAWLRDQGIETKTVAKAALPELLYEAEVSLAGNAYRALELRQEAAKSSTAKLKRMLEIAGEDDRARGLFQYHAASTGRFGGRLIQVQNFPRPEMTQNEIEDAINIMISGGDE